MASEPKNMPGDAEETTPQRGATRAPVQRAVRLQFDDAIDIVDAHCYNVSIGGMFVHCREGRQVGSLVRFELGLDDDLSIRGLAEVVWMRAQDHGPEKIAGMGLKFRFLEQRDRQLIFKLVSQHIKERLAARHPGLGDGEGYDSDEAQAPPPIRAAASTLERVSEPASADRSADLLPSIDDFEDAADTSPEHERGSPASRPAAPAAVVAQRSMWSEGGEAQVDDFDGGSQPTGAWLHEGLEDEASAGFERQAGFGGGTDGDDAAGYGYDELDDSGGLDDSSVRARERREPELADDGHFGNRPRPRRDVPVLTLIAVLVVALAVLAYLWGDRLFQSGTDDVTPSPLVGVESEGDVAADPTAASDPDVSSPASSPASSPSPPQVPPAVVPAAVEPPVEPPPAAAATTSGRPFRAVREISARAAGDAVEIIITTDGRVDANRFSHARLPDGAPRELLRLTGLGERYLGGPLAVGIGAVRQVRTGWHRKASGNELHIVIDLTNGSAQVTGVRVEGSRIIATIAG